MLLLAAMLLSACTLFGCAKEEEGVQIDTSYAITLVMWIVTNQSTTPEAIQTVQDAINRITKEKFKIQLVLQCYTEDEYYQKLEEALIYQATHSDGDSDEQETAEEETQVNQYGFTEIKYPDVRPYQADIVYFAGYDRYVSYADAGYLKNLDDMLEDEGMKMTKYISDAYLNGVQYGQTTYAIPNYNIAGKYKYMLIDRELYDKYYQLTPLNQINTVFDLEPFISRVSKYEDVLPIDSTFEDLKSQLAYFWSVNPGTLEVTKDFSLVGYTYTDYSKLNRGEVLLEFQNLLNTDSFTQNFRRLMEYKLDNCIGVAEEGERAAVSFVSGNASTLVDCGAVLINKNTDPEALYGQIKDDDSIKYYAVAVDYPTLGDEDIFGNLFGISAYSHSASRSMTVLNELNTNPEFRNLLQFGIEGINYTLTAEGQVHMLNNHYSMDLEKTGNVMIAYAYENTDPNWLEAAKAQNRDTTVDPLYQFSFFDEEYPVAVDDMFMSFVFVPDEDIENWSSAHEKYYIFIQDTEDKDGDGDTNEGEYVLADDTYDEAAFYYSWLDSYKSYIIKDAEGHRHPATSVYDSSATYYTDPFLLTYIDSSFMTEMSFSDDSDEIKTGKWNPSRYYVFDDETEKYVVATGSYDEKVTYYSWKYTRDKYVIKDENGYYQLAPSEFDPTLEYYEVTLDMKLVNDIYEMSAKVWESLMACTTLEQVDSLLVSYAAQYKSTVNETMDKATNVNYKTNDPMDIGLDSLYKIYYNWARSNKFLPQ